VPTSQRCLTFQRKINIDILGHDIDAKHIELTLSQKKTNTQNLNTKKISDSSSNKKHNSERSKRLLQERESNENFSNKERLLDSNSQTSKTLTVTAINRNEESDAKLAACEEACGQTPGCDVYIFLIDAAMCYMKRNAVHASTQAKEGTVAGICTKFSAL